jgi:hypothetical protein
MQVVQAINKTLHLRDWETPVTIHVSIEDVKFMRFPGKANCAWCSKNTRTGLYDEDGDSICGRCAAEGAIQYVLPFGDATIISVTEQLVEYVCRCGVTRRVDRHEFPMIGRCRHVRLAKPTVNKPVRPSATVETQKDVLVEVPLVGHSEESGSDET